MHDSFNVEIAGINLTVRCVAAKIPKVSDPAYTAFIKTERDPSALNVDIALEFGSFPDMVRATKIFDSGQSWSMFFDGVYYFLSLHPPAFDSLVWMARFDQGLERITVYCSEALKEGEKGPTVSNPVCYPLDQLLLMYVLARNGGAILHAAGVEILGKGYIFPGRSGAGKSTLARQLNDAARGEVLSDDRVAVRKIGNDFSMFGTPWPGEAGAALNKAAPLSGIFFISQGTENRIRDLNRQEALERLLPVTSIPWYDREVMIEILDLCDDLSSYVPAYELCFRPDGEVVHVLEEFASK